MWVAFLPANPRSSLLLLQIEGGGVDAVAQAGGARALLKDVSQVRVAAGEAASRYAAYARKVFGSSLKIRGNWWGKIACS